MHVQPTADHDPDLPEVLMTDRPINTVDPVDEGRPKCRMAPVVSCQLNAHVPRSTCGGHGTAKWLSQQRPTLQWLAVIRKQEVGVSDVDGRGL